MTTMAPTGPTSAGAARLGIQSIHTRSQAPQVNAVAERVVRTLRRECLDHLIVFDERHLLSVLQEFAAYYKEDRPDRTLALDTPYPVFARRPGRVRSRSVLAAYTMSMSAQRDCRRTFAGRQDW